MPTGNPELIEWLRAELAPGPKPFRWFMEQALYHPEYGYYASGRAAIGRGGDFFTSVSVGPLFGKLMALEFEQMWMRLGKPELFTIVEQGANHGDFAKDVLDALASSPLAGVVEYRIVEPLPRLRQLQIQRLAGKPRVFWHDSIETLPTFIGVHFSNELFDALPVHLLHYKDGQWRERYVDQQFQWVDAPLSCAGLETAHLPAIEGYQTEVNLEGPALLAAIRGKISSGFVLALDYGFERDVYYSESRSSGTLSCYSKHRRSYNPLEQIGECDITAHVEFTSLIEAAQKAGLRLESFTDQHHFMVALGSSYFRDCPQGPNPEQQKELRSFQALMHPGLMGLRFHALKFSVAS